MLEAATCYNLALESELIALLRDPLDGSAALALECDKLAARAKLTGAKKRSATVEAGTTKTVRVETKQINYSTASELLRKKCGRETDEKTHCAQPDGVLGERAEPSQPGFAVGEPKSSGRPDGNSDDVAGTSPRRAASVPPRGRSYYLKFAKNLTRVDGKNHFFTMLTRVTAKQCRYDDLGPQSAPKRCAQVTEQSYPLKRIGARVNMSKLLDPQKTTARGAGGGVSSGSGCSGSSSGDDMFSSSSSEDASPVAANEVTSKEQRGRDLKKATARENAAQAVKTGATLIGNLVGVLTHLALEPGVNLRELRLLVVCDTQELPGVCHFVSWLRIFVDGLRVGGCRRLSILVDVTPCMEHGAATAYEEQTKKVTDWLPSTYVSGKSFEKRYAGLAAKERFRFRRFEPQNDEDRQQFGRDALFEAHFHSFYRTLFADMPWQFRMVGGEDGAGQANRIEIMTPDEPESSTTFDDVVADFDSKLDLLFSCGSWASPAFSRWMRVQMLLQSICAQGYTQLDVLKGGVEYFDETGGGEPIAFTVQEQKKLREVAVGGLLGGLASHRAQAAALTNPSELVGASGGEMVEGDMRRLRWLAFRQGNVLASRRLMFLPHDAGLAGCGKRSREQAEELRDGAAVGLGHGNGGHRGRVVHRRTAWQNFLADYEAATSSGDDTKGRRLVEKLCADAKDVDGQHSHPPPRKKLELERDSDGFLRYLSAHDFRSSCVAFVHNAATLAAASSMEDRQRMLASHLFYKARAKDVSAAIECYNRHPTAQAQVFKTGAARNTEMNSACSQARHASGLFAAAEKLVARYEREKQARDNAASDYPARFGAHYEYRHQSGTRNELNREWKKVERDSEQFTKLREQHRDRKLREYADKLTKVENAATIYDHRERKEPEIVVAARSTLDRRDKLGERMDWLRSNLFLARSVVTDFARAATDPFSRYSFNKSFATPALIAMQQAAFWIPRPSFLAEALGLIRRNRAQARNRLKLQLPSSKKMSSLPEEFGKTEADTLRVATELAESYVAGKVDEKGRVIDVPATAGTATEEADAVARRLLEARFRQLLDAAAKKAVALAKRGPQSAEFWACQWDIGRTDRATLEKIAPASTSDAFVRLGGVSDTPLLVEIEDGSIALHGPENFGGAPTTFTTTAAVGASAVPASGLTGNAAAKSGGPKNDADSKAFRAMLDEHEKDLDPFYPTLDGYRGCVDLPPAFLPGTGPADLAAPRIYNDPYMLWEIKEELAPLTKTQKILKASLGPNDPGVADKTAKVNARTTNDAFVYNKAVARAYKIQTTYDFCSGCLHGMESQTPAMVEVDEEMAQEESEDDKQWSFAGVSSQGQDSMSQESRLTKGMKMKLLGWTTKLPFVCKN
eukprot:g15875.t1